MSENKVEQVERWKLLRESLNNLFSVSFSHSSVYWVSTMLYILEHNGEEIKTKNVFAGLNS